MSGELNARADSPAVDAAGNENPASCAFSAALDRRSFLKCALVSGAALSICDLVQPLVAIPSQAVPQKQDDSRFTVEAKFYQKLQNKKIKCKLCPRECTVGDKERGYCGVRENRGGTYYTLVHSRVCAAHIDPIEKKPLFHYLPGTLAFSLATAGCNVNCKFCQNWDISQVRPEQVPAEYAPPKLIPELAKQHGCPTIAYTYSEPVIFSEYLMDAADAGMKQASAAWSCRMAICRKTRSRRRTEKWTLSRSI